MSRPTAAIVLIAGLLAPIAARPAWAQTPGALRIAGLAPVRFLLSAPTPLTSPVGAPASGRDDKAATPRDRQAWLLVALYASTALVHGLDAHSTLTAFKYGAVETNPLMQWAHARPDVFVAVKAAVAASTILAARALARRHRATAIVMLTVINGAYIAIVHHNYDVGRRLK